MEQRTAQLQRQTKETDITCQLNLDGIGGYEIDTGVGFLDHMLTHLSKHSKIDLAVKASGDLEVDAHHTVEDIAICLGECLIEALGDKKGIARYGNSSLPMEDALANIALDLSGRSFCVYNVDYRSEGVGPEKGRAGAADDLDPLDVLEVDSHGCPDRKSDQLHQRFAAVYQHKHQVGPIDLIESRAQVLGRDGLGAACKRQEQSE